MSIQRKKSTPINTPSNTPRNRSPVVGSFMDTPIDANKKNIILDLDNTLISAEAIEDFPFDDEGMKEKAIQFILHDMDGYYIVFERPHVQSFLDWLFENYNVSVWTAASKDYALFIIQRILLNKKRKLNHILFSYHCSLSKQLFNGDTKNLKFLFDVIKMPGYNANNSIIIDDLDTIYESQPNNCIHIKEFNIFDKDSELDDQLIHVQQQIKDKFDTLSQ